MRSLPYSGRSCTIAMRATLMCVAMLLSAHSSVDATPTHKGKGKGGGAKANGGKSGGAKASGGAKGGGSAKAAGKAHGAKGHGGGHGGTSTPPSASLPSTSARPTSAAAGNWTSLFSWQQRLIKMGVLVRLRGDAAAVVDELPQVVDPRAQPRRVDVHARVVHLSDR